MIINTDKLKEVCKDMMYSMDTVSTSPESSLIALSNVDNKLKLEITNREYYVSTLLPLEILNEEFYATIKSDVFLKLIPKLTTKDIEIELKDNILLINSNGNYKIPLIFEGNSIVKIPEINIDNVVNSFSIDTEIIKSINKYNSIELQKKSNITSPLHRLFYIDENGCITYNTGACVNNFTLPKPIRLVLNEKVVKLFKLFKSDSVNFKMGFDQIGDNLIQTKIELSDDITKVSSIVSIGNDLINKFPAKQIRDRVNSNYPYTMVIDRSEVLKSIERLSIFNLDDKIYIPLEISSDKITIFDTNGYNSETLSLLNTVDIEGTYKCKFKLSDLEVVLKSCVDKYLTINFGNHQAIVIDRKTVKNILPEVIGD